jgi:hypothetical protein
MTGFPPGSWDLETYDDFHDWYVSLRDNAVSNSKSLRASFVLLKTLSLRMVELNDPEGDSNEPLTSDDDPSPAPAPAQSIRVKPQPKGKAKAAGVVVNETSVRREHAFPNSDLLTTLLV